MRLLLLAMTACTALAPLRPAAAEAPEGEAGLFRGIRLTPGPVRWGGSAGVELRSQKAAGQGRTLTRLELLNVNAATYLWQPWFAQVRGGLGVLRSSAGGDGERSKGSSLTGDLGLSLFPVSRFPFDAHLSRTDSRASGELTASEFRTTRAGARQSYRTADESTSYLARAERSTLTSESFGRDTLDVLEAGMTRRLGAHQVELNGNVAENRGGNGVASQLARASGRHAFNPASNLSVESLASASRSAAASAQGAFVTRFNQLTSFGSWRPGEAHALHDEERPLLVTASGRVSTLQSETSGGDASDTGTLNGSLGAAYALSRSTRINGSATATRTTTPAGDTTFTSQAGNLVYAPDPRPLGAFTYSWNASGGVTNTTATGQGAAQTTTAQASHGVSRSLPAGEAAALSFSAGQGASASHAESGDAVTVTHHAGANWSAGNGSGAQTYVGLSASDARTFGASRGAFQLVNLQATRQNALTNLSYWTGNFTVQGTRQSLPQLPGEFDWTTFGSLTYLHQRAFGVGRLRFTGTYTASLQQVNSRAAGDLDASREFTSSALEGRFDYVIGKLELRLSARSAVIEGARHSLVFLRAVRNF